MSVFHYNCSCGSRATFDVIDHREYKCLNCGRIISIRWNYITDGFEIYLKEENKDEEDS